MKQVTAQESTKLKLDQASFEETHHRVSDGLIVTNKETWRTRNNNKPMRVTRT